MVWRKFTESIKIIFKSYRIYWSKEKSFQWYSNSLAAVISSYFIHWEVLKQMEENDFNFPFSTHFCTLFIYCKKKKNWWKRSVCGEVSEERVKEEMCLAEADVDDGWVGVRVSPSCERSSHRADHSPQTFVQYILYRSCIGDFKVVTS